MGDTGSIRWERVKAPPREETERWGYAHLAPMFDESTARLIGRYKAFETDPWTLVYVAHHKSRPDLWTTVIRDPRDPEPERLKRNEVWRRYWTDQESAELRTRRILRSLVRSDIISELAVQDE